tara:strand:+ start:72 stop:323 length:252 start_codon:yes stop_codon:yes gene_type:complete
MEDKIRRIMDDSTDHQTGEVDAEIAISKLLVLFDVIPSAYLMVIDKKEVVVLADNIADAMDKAESTGSEDYKMAFNKSFNVLH